MRVAWLKDLRLKDLDQVGGKNASLGEMIGGLAAAGIRVPGGFATTADAFREFLAALKARSRFCLDTETTNLDPLRAELVGLSFAWEPGVAYYLPVRGPSGSRLLDPDATVGDLKPILEDPRTEKVGQNLKYDMLVLRRYGIEVGGPVTDTMVAV